MPSCWEVKSLVWLGFLMLSCPAGAANGDSSFVLIKLPTDRHKLGTLELIGLGGLTVAGPFWVLGKSDNANAIAKQNPQRIRTNQGGDFPFGSYQITELSPRGSRPESTYGQYGVLILKPNGGEAELAAANGRKDLRIHGGELKGGRYLRPTEGCLRMRDSDFLQLVSTVKSQSIPYPIVVTVVVGNPSGVPDLFCAPNE